MAAFKGNRSQAGSDSNGGSKDCGGVDMCDGRGGCDRGGDNGNSSGSDGGGVRTRQKFHRRHENCPDTFGLSFPT